MMEKETLIFNGSKFHRYPLSKHKHLRDYFWAHKKWKEPPTALHREVWIDKNGAIPKGFHIHHKDENTLNNNLENLICVSGKKHISSHIKKKWQDKEYRAKALLNLDDAREKSHVWRRSKQGRDFGRKNVYGSLIGKPRSLNCSFCGERFTTVARSTTGKTAAKFCSRSCTMKFSRKVKLRS